MTRPPKTTGRSVRAATYVRVSTTRQEEDGTSLDTQEAACRSYCEERGYTVVAVYSDTHSGADLYERSGLSALRAAIRAHDVDIVVAHALDRLSRDQNHRGLIFSESDYAGVEIHFVTERLKDSAEGRLLLAVRSFTAEVERLKITERTQRGVRARVAAGKPLPGPRPLYGYRWRDADKTALEIDPVNGPVVRRIVDGALTGKSLRAIAASLDADRIPTPNGGRQWAISVLSSMLKHPAYCGQAAAMRWRTERRRGSGIRQLRRPQSEHVSLPDGIVPPLMSSAEFDAIGQRLKRNQERATRNNKTPTATLLRGGFVRCAICGCALNVERRTGRRGQPWYRYRCSNHQGSPKPSMAAANLDADVWRLVERILTDDTVIAAKVNQLESDDQLTDQSVEIGRRLATVQTRRQRLAKAVALLDDDDAATPLLEELRSLAEEAKRLDAERSAFASQQVSRRVTNDRLAEIQTWCRRVAANLPKLSYEERRQLLEQLGVTVTLWPSDAPQRWEVVMQPNPSDSQGSIAFGTASH